MSTVLVDVAVGGVIFILGIALSLRKFSGQDYIVLVVSAVLTPILAVFAVFFVLFAAIRGENEVNPCPDGLEEAERIVEGQRQQMFGGPLRPPSISTSWKRAYQSQLQKETRQVQTVARRFLVIE